MIVERRPGRTVQLPEPFVLDVFAYDTLLGLRPRLPARAPNFQWIALSQVLEHAPPFNIPAVTDENHVATL
jgi:hypothetical protein